MYIALLLSRWTSIKRPTSSKISTDTQREIFKKNPSYWSGTERGKKRRSKDRSNIDFLLRFARRVKERAWKDRWGRWGGEGERGGSITHSSNRERHNSVWQVSSIIREKKEQYVFSLLLPTSSPSLPPPFYIVIHSIALNGDRHAGESRFYRFIIYLFLLL